MATSSQPLSPPTKTYTFTHSAATLATHSRRTAAKDMRFLLAALPSLFPTSDEPNSDQAFPNQSLQDPCLTTEFFSQQRPQLSKAHILDVGCGPGSITCDYTALVPDGLVVGVDFSEDVLGVARKAARERGIGNARFVRGSAFDLGGIGSAAGLGSDAVETGTGPRKGEEGERRNAPEATPTNSGADCWDVITCNQLLLHLSDPLAALREMRRVLKPGGILAVREADLGGMVSEPNGMLDLTTKILVDSIRSGGGDPWFGRRMLGVALRAGFGRETVWAGGELEVWSTPQERAQLGETYAQRWRSSQGTEAVRRGVCTSDELEEAAGALDRFAGSDCEDGMCCWPQHFMICVKS